MPTTIAFYDKINYSARVKDNTENYRLLTQKKKSMKVGDSLSYKKCLKKSTKSDKWFRGATNYEEELQ